MTTKKSTNNNITMSVPEGVEFNTPYNLHNESYYEVDRNGPLTSSFDLKLDLELKKIGELLKSKNKAYGDTALNPSNVFSKLSSTEAICARLDDKLARIKNKGINDKTEDTVDDLIGYLLLLKMSI
tara:strand:+ start:1444 stop:1821 length:378 start_codon:yes stop_codon:yes gene_type:complete